VASGTVTTPFNPATLNLTGWWRLIYPGKVAMDGGAHWVGTASAGTSGAHDLSKLVGSNRSPHDGATLNGMLTANFQTTTADILEEHRHRRQRGVFELHANVPHLAWRRQRICRLRSVERFLDREEQREKFIVARAQKLLGAHADEHSAYLEERFQD
jgi:hypothetical protein